MKRVLLAAILLSGCTSSLDRYVSDDGVLYRATVSTMQDYRDCTRAKRDCRAERYRYEHAEHAYLHHYSPGADTPVSRSGLVCQSVPVGSNTWMFCN